MVGSFRPFSGDGYLSFVCRALAVNPAQPSTHSAIGLTYQLLGEPFKAVESYHAALAMRPDDAVAGEMLGAAVSEAAGFL